MNADAGIFDDELGDLAAILHVESDQPDIGELDRIGPVAFAD